MKNVEDLEYIWPVDYPEGFPDMDEVKPAEGTVFRLVDTIPPTEGDFISHGIERPDYNYKKSEQNLSYGVSFWTKLQKVQRLKEKYPSPEQFGNKKIAYGNLMPELGVIPLKEKHRHHITLWKQEGAQPHLHICLEAS